MKEKTTFLTKALTLLFVMLFTLTGARAETLTVHNGTTTNQYVPVYGYWADNYSRSQFIIASSDLEDMFDGSITGMTFYASNQNVSWGNAKFDVYLAEVSETSISALKDWSTLTMVYTGSLSISGGQMTITFNTPYRYLGGNLLVGINETTSGTYSTSNWYGETFTDASMGGYGSNISQQNFIPKTTFTYTPTSFVRPQNVTVSNVKTNSASIVWNGTANSYNLRYASAGSTATIILTAHDVWGDGSGYQMLLDADANAYGNVFTSNDGWTASDYSAFEYTVPVGAECNMNTSTVVANGSVTIQIPAGTYDWCITNPTPGDQIYIASGNGNVGGRQDDYVFEGGKTYEFNITLGSGAQQSYDKVDVTITDNSTIADADWTTISNVTSPYSLESLSASTSYRVEVQAVYNGGVSEWAGCNFTTLAINHVVTDVAVTPQSTTANISWTGESDTYQINYKKKATVGTSTSFFEDFENGLNAQGWTTVRKGDGTTNTDWHQFDATNFSSGTVTNHSGSYVAMSRSYASSAYNVDNWLITPQVTLDGMLKYWVRDDGAYHEHYDVYVSTTGTNLEDFTLFYEPGNASSTWTEVSVDLSSFAGQQGYIALRNKDYDKDFLLIDDFGIYEILSPAGDLMTVTTAETSIELTALVPGTEYEFTIIGIKDGASNSGTPIDVFTTLDATTIELSNAGDNTGLIEALDGMTFDVKLAERTLSGSNTWNSLCLPFDVTLADSPLAGADVRTLTSGTIEGTILHLHFTPAGDITELEAGKPYIVRFAGSSIVEPVFTNVTIDNSVNDIECSLDDGITITFKGTYKKLDSFESPRSILYMGGDNKLYYPGSTTYIGSQRAYFQLGGITIATSSQSSGIKGFQLYFDEDPTGIDNVNANLNLNDEVIYNIAGQRMGNMQKGVNIVNGKKIFVK